LTFCAESPKRVAEGGKRIGETLRALIKQRSRSADGPAIETV